MKLKQSEVSLLLDRLVQLDRETSGAYYEMGQILFSIKRGKLWEVLGYDSFPHMVEEELTYTVTTAHRYAQTYAHFQRLKYTKKEALELMYEYGFSNLSDYLPSAKDKVGTRTVGNRIKAMLEERHQVNFQLNKKDYEDLQKALIAEGAEITDGRLLNSSSALMRLVRKVRGRHLKSVA